MKKHIFQACSHTPVYVWTYIVKADEEKKCHYWLVCVFLISCSRFDLGALNLITYNSNALLKSDVTRRDHVSVVMDAGSRIVNFIRDGTVFA